MKVNPNRMELLKLKKRLVMAKRGHKLLKDKFDELMKHFFVLIRNNSKIRNELEGDLKIAYRLFSIVRGDSPFKVIEQALKYTDVTMDIDFQYKNLLNIEVPEFDYEITGKLDYDLISTPVSLDSALVKFNEIIPKLIELAEVEKSIELLATEIEKTRRRVNALEYVLIPNLISSIRFITMKLDEVERDSRTRTMKIKEMVQ